MRRLFFILICFLPNIVNSQNHPPTINQLSDITIGEGSTKNIVIQATDPDNLKVIPNPNIVIVGSSTAEGDKASVGNAWRERLDNFLKNNLSNYSLNRKTVRGHTSYHKMPDNFIPPPNRPLPAMNSNISSALNLNPNIIIVNLPSNDVANNYDLNETIENFKIIKSEADNKNVKIFFTTTQPRNFSEFSNRLELKKKADTIIYVFGNNSINIYDTLVNQDNLLIKSIFDADGTHPNDDGHKAIFEKVVNKIEPFVIKDTVKFSFNNLPSFASFKENDEQLTLTLSPNFNDAGTYDVDIYIFDHHGYQTSATFQIIVEEREPLGGTQTLKSFNHTVNNGGVMDYYQYYPQNFDISAENHALLISLHGNAERGGDPTRMLGPDGSGSLVKLIDEGNHYPLMIVSPHQRAFIGGKSTDNWSIPLLKQLVNHLIADYNVDPKRIYMTGFSGGGQAVWQYAVEYPNDLAAIVPLAGLTDLKNQSYGINLAESTFACKISEIPIKVWHGNNDTKVNKSHSIDMVNAINNCLPTPDPMAQLILVSGMDHDPLRGYIYSNITGDNNIFDWFLSITNGEPIPDLYSPKFINNTPSITNKSQTSFNLNVNIDEDGTIFYGIYDSGSNPSLSDIESGQGSGYIQSGSVIGRSMNKIISNLTAGTSYDLYVFAQDDEEIPNKQSQPVQLATTTLPFVEDNDPPMFQITPVVDLLNSGSVQIRFQLNEPGVFYWNLYNANKDLLTVEDIIEGSRSIQADSIFTDGSIHTFQLNGLLSSKKYYFYCIAKDDESSPNIQLNYTYLSFETLSSSIGSVPETTIQINPTKGNTSTISGWNNLDFANVQSGSNHYFLKDATGIPINVSLTLYHRENGSFLNNVADNKGALNEGIFPDPVSNFAAYTSGAAKFQFYNLDPTKFYTITLYGARAASGSRISKYTLENQSKFLEVVNNQTEVVQFEKISPRSNGTINLEMSKDNSNWAYLNAMLVEVFSGLADDKEPPSQVADFTGIYNVSENINELNWIESTEQDFSTYNLYRSKYKDLPINDSILFKSGITNNNYLDNNITNDTYYYYVTAVDINGNESIASAQLEITVGEPDTIPPNPPSELTASAIDNNIIELYWGFPFEENISFKIYRDTINSFPLSDEKLLINNLENNQFKDSLLAENTLYFYKIIAVDNALNESNASEISIRTLDFTPPSAPDGLTGEALSHNQIALSWNTNDEKDFRIYQLYRNITGTNLKDIENLVIEQLKSSFIDTQLEENTVYYYQIYAIDTNNNVSTGSEILNIKTNDITPPPTPLNLTLVSAGLNQAELTWDSVSADDFAAYKLFRDINPDFSTSTDNLVDSINTNFFIDENLAPSSSYYYKISSIDTSGNESQSSEGLMVQTLSPDSTVPAIPLISKITFSNYQIDLSWTNNVEDDFHYYSIYQNWVPDFSTSTLLEEVFYDTLYTFKNLNEKSTSYFWITATDYSGNTSSPSGDASIYIPDLTAPSVPVGLSVVSNNGNSISIQWISSLSNDLEYYEVYRDTISGLTLSESAKISNTTDTSFIDNVVVEKETYFYKITSVDSSGNVSEESIELQVIVPDITPPAKPENVTYSESEFLLQWTQNSEVDFSHYIVFRNTENNFIGSSIVINNLTNPYYTLDDLHDLNTYYFWVIAVDQAGNQSDPSTMLNIFIPDLTSPSIPTALSVDSVSKHFVNIIWSPNQEEDLMYYTLYRNLTSSLGSENSTILNDSIFSTSYRDNSIMEKNTYFYFVTASDSSGNTSLKSEEVEITIPDFTPPPTPQNLTCQQNAEIIEISWEMPIVTDLQGFRIYKDTTQNFDISQVTPLIISADNSLFLDSDFEPFQEYYYKVTAFDSALNESLLSEEIKIQTKDFYVGPVLDQTININFTRTGLSSGLPEWNDIGMTYLPSQTNVFADLLNQAGNSTNISLEVLQANNGSYINNVADNKNSLVNGVFPNQILRYSAYVTGKGLIYITNLNGENTYNITIHGGRAASGSRITNYVVQGISNQLECVNNTSNTVLFKSISPDSDNKIVVEFTPENTWGYINGLVIEEFKNYNARINKVNSEKLLIIKDTKIFPNPGSKFLNIKLPESVNNLFSETKIFDINGKLIYNEKSEGNQYRISILNIKPGKYLINVFLPDLDLEYSQLFIKQ